MSTKRTTVGGGRGSEGKGMRFQARRRVAATLVLAACVGGTVPGCGEGFVIGGLLGLGAAASSGSPEAALGGAVMGEVIWFSICMESPQMPYFDTIFFQSATDEGGEGHGRVACADGVGRAWRRAHEPRLVVGPTGCTLTCRF
ncbi:MAG: hypothetical protein ACYTKD_15610 [Planctomycetota bacterium]|jgi:hypothetical protein